MVDLAAILSPEGVIAELRSAGKRAALEDLASHAAALTGVDQRRLFAVLLERERLGSTGVGNGIAIPHGKLSELDRLQMLFARTRTPIDFEAMDDEKVDLFCLLLAPEEAGAEHLKVLARISRQLRDPAFCNKLREAQSREVIHALITSDAGDRRPEAGRAAVAAYG